jgi:hypothetical protein
MNDAHFWIPTCISLFAVVVSAASWWHNWSAHSERRFGEIVKLRSAVIQRLTEVAEGFRVIDSALSSVRFDLHRLPDSVQKKYEWIEGSPALNEEADEFRERVRDLRYSLSRLSTEDYSASILKKLQLAEHELGALENGASQIGAIVKEQASTIAQIKKAEDDERDRNYAELERLAAEEKRKQLS